MNGKIDNTVKNKRGRGYWSPKLSNIQIYGTHFSKITKEKKNNSFSKHEESTTSLEYTPSVLQDS